MALPWRPFPQGYPLVSPRRLTLDSQPENETSNLEATNWQPLSRTYCAKWVIVLLLLVSVYQASLVAQLVKDLPAMQECTDHVAISHCSRGLSCSDHVAIMHYSLG